ncbi:MAG: PDZ domain-containing protein, partial [Chloroflexi bacterium]|nr:PDZ domain-containing protein [Chloroflexota bacterium]
MEKKDRTWLWILLAVVGLLLSCALGAVAGGISGYVVAKKVGQRSEQIIVPTPPRLQLMPFQTPVPMPTPTPPARQARLAAMVVRIAPNSPAEDAGLRLGDMIYAVSDEVITQERDLA